MSEIDKLWKERSNWLKITNRIKGDITDLETHLATYPASTHIRSTKNKLERQLRKYEKIIAKIEKDMITAYYENSKPSAIIIDDFNLWYSRRVHE